MDKEATKILNTQQNSISQTGNKTEKDAPKKETEFCARTAATATGAALGTSAAMVAEHIYEASVTEPEVEQDKEVKVEENTTEGAAATEEVLTTAEAQPQHQVVEHVATVKVDQPVTEEPETVPSDGQYIDDSTPEPTTTSGTEGDGEVHVIGVAVQDNGQGGMATLAGIQYGDDNILVVDVESDGTIDIIGHDDNQNGQLETNELHQVDSVPFGTTDVVGAYVADAHENGSQAVVTNIDNGEQYQITETESGYGLASMDEPTPDDSLYTTSDDDMPDYMNDADAGIMDA